MHQLHIAWVHCSNQDEYNIHYLHAYLGEVWEHAVPSGHLLTCEAV